MYTVNQLGQPVVKMDFSNSMEFIRETTLTVATATITWDNIPQDYTHLVVTGQARSAYAATYGYVLMRFNGDSGSNYWSKWLQAYGTGATPSSGIVNGTEMQIGLVPGSTSSANYYGAVQVTIPNYSRGGYYKSLVAQASNIGTSAATSYVRAGIAADWANTSPITSITLLSNSGNNFAAGSSFSLYGIRNIENRALGTLNADRARFRATWDGVTTQNITNNTPNIIQFPTVIEDTHSGWSSYQYTIPRTGIYAVDFRILLSAYTTAITHWVETDLILNSSTETRGDREWGNGGSQNIGSEFSEIRKFTAGDVLGFYVHQLSGATRTIYASNQWNTVSVMEIGV